MSDNHTNMQRVFLVGCPRSGTTLLQSLLASHSRIVSFPETHLLSGTIPIHKPGQLFKIYLPGTVRTLTDQLIQLGLPDEQLPDPGRITFRTTDWIEIVLNHIDALARHTACSDETVWLEKTPRHLHYAGLITYVDPTVKFIHINRRGEHVVPSLYFATQANPEKWNGARSIPKCVKWWNRSVRLSSRFMEDPAHLHVTYRQLVNETEAVMEAILHFLELPYEETILDEYHKTAGSLIADGERWKRKNRRSEIKAGNKLGRLNDSERQYIEKNLIRNLPLTKMRV